jgi:hypothetical protein
MGFDHSHYVPILKGKQGELKALQKAEKLYEHFTPLVEIPPIPPRYLEGQDEPIPAKTIEQHINDMVLGFAAALKGIPSFFVDPIYIESEDDLQDGRSPVDAAFSGLREANIPFTPVIGLDRLEDSVDAVKTVIHTDKRGCCLRLFESDIESISDTEDQIKSLLNALTIKASEVDLLCQGRSKSRPLGRSKRLPVEGTISRDLRGSRAS